MDNIHILETELKQLMISRSDIDLRIAELEASIEILKRQTEPGFNQLFQTEALPDILDEQINEMKIIRRSSDIEKKYNLFISLFAGRPDVHAMRFQRKSGSSGYSPVCANQFDNRFCPMSSKVKGKPNCISCEHKDFPPITLDSFIDHLLGRDDRCCDVLGAYPIDKDDLCSFIVADFDGKKKAGDEDEEKDGDKSVNKDRAIMTASAFRQTCLKNQVPTYLEISRSGKGYHAWLFFAEQVPAVLARRLFSKLWTITMDENPGLDFSVYDRFIPSQDTLSNHGLQGSLGNLVALPFQGRVGKEKLTSFLDSQFKFYPDQWEFLSKVKRLSDEELDSAVSRLGSISELGELVPNDDDESPKKPWAKRNPVSKLQHNDFAGTVEIVQANMLHIKKTALSPRALNRTRRLAAFSNPEFYKLQRMRFSTHNEPRVISTHQEDDEYLSIPRGAKPGLVELLISAGAIYVIHDMTSRGMPLDVQFKFELRDKQPQAAKALLSHDIGVLSAGTAFGKTVVAASIIASRKVSTLVLVHNQPLLNQWKAALEAQLEIMNEPPIRLTPTGRKKKLGVIGEYHGKKKAPTGLVDIAMIQSLSKKGVVEDFIKDHGMVIVDEAHHVPASSFESVLQHVNAKYVYGLTATPSRKDGRAPIIFLECGPIRYKTDAKELAEESPFDHFMVPRFTGLQRTSVRDEKNFSALLSDVVIDDARNQLIADDVRSVLGEGRKPIILTDRTEHVTALAGLLRGSCKNVIPLLGKHSEREKKEAEELLKTLPEDEAFVIIATGKLVGEGFDYPRLDTLFLASPISWKGRIAQYAGRLHRVHEGKNDVYIYDYVDTNIPVLDNMYHKRIKGYKSISYAAVASVTSEEDKRNQSENLIFGKDDYWALFHNDCEQAVEEIVVTSPKMQLHQVTRFISALSAPLLRNTKLSVITLPLEEHTEAVRPTVETCFHMLIEQGIKIIQRPGLHQKTTIIDQKVVWYGSLCFLGNALKTDNLMRFAEPTIAKKLLAELNKPAG